MILNQLISWILSKLSSSNDEFDLCPVAKNPKERILQLEEICRRHVAFQQGMLARLNHLSVDDNPYYCRDNIKMSTITIMLLVAWQNGWDEANKLL